jgi:hypothetical protein
MRSCPISGARGRGSRWQRELGRRPPTATGRRSVARLAEVLDAEMIIVSSGTLRRSVVLVWQHQSLW